MEHSAQSSHWMAHWTKKSRGEGAHSFSQPFDLLGKKDAETNKASARGLLCSDSQGGDGFKHGSSSSKRYEKKNSDKLHNMFNTTGTFQSSFNKVETTRICTTVDSVVGLSGRRRHSRFSQTTHSMFITNKTDSNLFKDTDFGTPPFNGVKIPSLQRFMDSEPQEKSKGVIYRLTKLESIKEKKVEDAHDSVKIPSLQCFMDSKPQEKSKGTSYRLTKLEGIKEKKKVEDAPDSVKIPSLQCFMDSEPQDKSKGTYRLTKLEGIKEKKKVEDSELSAETIIMDMANSEKTRHGVHSSSHAKGIIKHGVGVSYKDEEDRTGQHTMKVPNMNLEAPTSSTEEQSTSRTQSLDKETVLSHAEPVVKDGLEPGSRWLKRLKLMNGSIGGTKTSDCMENPHHKRGINNNHGKEVMVVDEATSSYMNNRDVLLSKSWIRRWCHNNEANTKKNVKAEVGDETYISKKKQFPSIAAMALMAKTMNCLESYDIHNRGAVMVWNTKGF